MKDIEIFDNQHQTENSDGLSGTLGVATKTHQMYELVQTGYMLSIFIECPQQLVRLIFTLPSV